MVFKDYLALTLSVIAVVVSVVAFLLTFRQRASENRRGIRKALTETIADLTSVSLERAKLDRENPSSMDDKVVGLRRLYNNQRRYLANHAEFLIGQIPDLVTDIDYNALAFAFDAIGDPNKAKRYWELCVEKSPSRPLQAMNLRGYARFLYFQGQFETGRRKYEESLQVELPDTDNMRRILADTYLMWSKTEHDFGFLEEAKRQKEQAISVAKRIGHVGMRNEMLNYVSTLWAGLSPKVSES
jgi:tetratricopeptide (TPR) repeat protein